MNSKNEKIILQVIKYAPPFFIISLSIIISIALYLNHKKNFNEEKINIQQEFIKKNKHEIKSKVDRVYDQIKLQQSNTEFKLKQTLKSRVYEAYTIALNIYNENKHLEKEKIQKMIKDALRNIRFNNGRGYFFIYSFDYECILLPVAEKLEGTSFYNFKEGKGSYLTRNIIKQVKKEKEGFLTWWYHKPSDMKNQYKKLGFNKHFEPFNWFIGTGEYIEDFENDIKKETLAHIQNLKFDNNGYIFVLDYNGTYLSHIKKEIIGLNALEAKDTRTYDTIKEAINIAKNKKSGFLSYIQNKKPGTNQASKKISYIKGISNWQWLIGYGFYEDDFLKLVEIEETTLNKRFEENLNSLFITTSILTIILLFISIYISKLLEKRFKTYKDEITKQQYILSQQSKMAAIGTMIGNIAHQWRQPLSIISTAATGMSLKKELGILEEKELVESLDSINKSTQYLSKTIDDFRNFFLSNKEKKDFYINKAIKKALNLVDAQFKNHNISVISNLEIIETYGVETELIQVLINILNNAKDELVKIKDYDRLVFIDTKIKDNLVNIKIRDNAGGVSEKILDHVFEPYFTTKHQSQGTGIGLYMSREIVVKHLNGSILMKNSTFTYKDIEYKGAEISIIFELIK